MLHLNINIRLSSKMSVEAAEYALCAGPEGDPEGANSKFECPREGRNNGRPLRALNGTHHTCLTSGPRPHDTSLGNSAANRRLRQGEPLPAEAEREGRALLLEDAQKSGSGPEKSCLVARGCKTGGPISGVAWVSAGLGLA